MVRSSPAINQVYNCEANDVGPVSRQVCKRSFTNCLPGKAAEWAVLTDNSVKTKKPIEYIYGKVEAKECQFY